MGPSCAARRRAVAWPSCSPDTSLPKAETTILDELARHRARASFFLTGDFLANPRFQPLVRRIVDERHYLGPHSDKHLLYCTWDKDKKTLVSQGSFRRPICAATWRRSPDSGRTDRSISCRRTSTGTREIAAWTAELGLQLINFTPGTRSNADYTEDDGCRTSSRRA